MTQKLPKQVQRQVDEALRLEQQLQTEVSTPPTAVQDVSQLTQPAPLAPPVEPVPALPPVVEQKPVKDFEHMYRVLEGKYRAEVPALQQQLRASSESTNALRQQLDAMQAQPKPVEKPATDPKDVETFGADMIEMVQRYAQTVFSQLSTQYAATVQAVEARIGKLEEAVTGVSKQATLTLEQQFWRDVATAVPDWEAINASDKFIAWLADVDPVYGAPRQAALDAAQQRLDAQRVAAVFNAFKALAQTAQAPAPNPLASQVAPSTAVAAPVQAHAPNTQVISMKAVTAFYDDVRRGVYRGREAEAARIENEINTAAAEGRIQ